MIKVRPWFLAGIAACGLGASVNVHAAAGFAAGFKAGMQTYCTSCYATAKGTLTGIEAAIQASEQAIGRALNEGPFRTGLPIGFPTLYTQIEGSTSVVSRNLQQQLLEAENAIDLAILKAPAVAERQRQQRRVSPMVSDQDRAGCRATEYGQLMDREPRSSLGWGWQYVTTGRFETIDGEPIGESVGRPSTESRDEDGIKAAMIDSSVRAAQVSGQTFRTLETRAESAGKPGAKLTDILNPAILYSESPKTFDDEPDAYGVSDVERADYLIQYLMVDEPTFADDFQASAVTPAQIAASVDGQIDNMRFGLAMGVLDELMQLRQPRAGVNDADAFLAEAMGEPAPEATSHDEFFYRLSHYRQKDPSWIAKTVISEEYAVSQQVQMESEALAIKWERWKTKRQKVLLLAQAVANMNKSEHPTQ